MPFFPVMEYYLRREYNNIVAILSKHKATKNYALVKGYSNRFFSPGYFWENYKSSDETKCNLSMPKW